MRRRGEKNFGWVWEIPQGLSVSLAKTKDASSASCIVVEKKDDGPVELGNLRYLGHSKGGPHRCHRGQVGGIHRYYVQVPFSDEDGGGGGEGCGGILDNVQAKDNVSLLEYRGLGRVEVLGRGKIGIVVVAGNITSTETLR